MLIGPGWVCLSCLFHVELSVALPSGITCCFLSCPTWPERASLTLPLKGVPGGDSAGSAVPGSGSAAGKAEKLSTVLQFLVRKLQGRCVPPVLVALPRVKTWESAWMVIPRLSSLSLSALQLVPIPKYEEI